MRKLFVLMTVLLLLIPMVSAFNLIDFFKNIWNSLTSPFNLEIVSCTVSEDCCAYYPNRYVKCTGDPPYCGARDSQVPSGEPFLYCNPQTTTTVPAPTTTIPVTTTTELPIVTTTSTVPITTTTIVGVTTTIPVTTTTVLGATTTIMGQTTTTVPEITTTVEGTTTTTIPGDIFAKRECSLGNLDVCISNLIDNIMNLINKIFGV